MSLFHFFLGLLNRQSEQETVLDSVSGLDVGYLGEPFCCGQVNETDAEMYGMDFGYLGEPFVVWSNDT